MTRTGRPLFVAVALALTAVAACVIAEPPADLPTLPPQAPRIVRGSVVPPPTAVLTRWPDKFLVPVQLADPRSSIQYATFIDYNSVTGCCLDGAGVVTSGFDLQTTTGSTRLLELDVSEPSPDSCHVIEMVVANQLSSSDGRSAHTPLPPGGDSVSWFYSPSGDLAGCPVADAGLLPDAAALESIDASFP